MMKLVKVENWLWLSMAALLAACVPNTQVKNEAMTLTEAKNALAKGKADLEIPLLAPPASKKLVENLIMPLEIGEFKVRGIDNADLGPTMADKISASITDAGYVDVVMANAAGTLTGTLTLSATEKSESTSNALGGSSESSLGNSLSSGLTTFGGNVIGGVLGNGVLGNAAKQSFGGNPLETKTSTKKVSAVLQYKIVNEFGQVLASGDVNHELTDQQSAALWDKASVGQNHTSDSRMTNELLDTLAEKVTAEVSPHTEVFLFNWAKSGCADPSFEAALKYASQGINSEAETAWKKLESGGQNNKCRAAALHNLALLKLRNDPKSKVNQKEAYDMLGEANGLDPGNEKEIIPALNKLKSIALTDFKSVARAFGTFRLTVNVKPKDSEITIVHGNEELDYEPGMRLAIGHYKVKVSAPGKKTKTRALEIKDHDQTVNIKL